jgi:hypothetical protein
MPTHSDAGWLPRGTPVQVRDRFEFTFRSGFEVSRATDAGYRLRRTSDGVELPTEFAQSDVRPDAPSKGWR